MLSVPAMTVDTVEPFLAGKGAKFKEEIETRSVADPQFLNGTPSADSSNFTSSNSEYNSGLETRRSCVMECDAARLKQAASNKLTAGFMEIVMCSTELDTPSLAGIHPQTDVPSSTTKAASAVLAHHNGPLGLDGAEIGDCGRGRCGAPCKL